MEFKTKYMFYVLVIMILAMSSLTFFNTIVKEDFDIQNYDTYSHINLTNE